jgi:hypothetical protein
VQELLLAALAQQHLRGLAQQVTASYDAGAQSVTVTAVINVSHIPNLPGDITAAQEQTKTVCYRLQEALWTSRGMSGLALRQVTAIVVGPILDQYAYLTTSAYGTAVLTAPVGHISMGRPHPDVAWEKYDNVFLATSYNEAS